MPDFNRNIGTGVTPWGVREFLRSTKDFGTESYMCAKDTVPFFTRDGNPYQKELPAGVVMAKVTAGPNLGKVGPFQAAGTAEVQTITKGSGTYSGGSLILGVAGSSDPHDTATLAWNAVAGDVAAALASMPSYAAFVPNVTGGPLGSAPFVVTFGGGDMDADVPMITIDVSGVTGQTGAATVAQTTQGVSGAAADGRSTLANIVGLNLTTLPWQLRERDVEISVVYDCEAVQGWCMELNAAGMYVPLSNTTAAAMQRGGAAGKLVDIGWH